jgi:2-oxoisovalerate dehydrogenase E1 component
MTAILTTLWTKIFAAPEIVKSVAGVKLVARFRYTDYGCALYIDLSGNTPRFYFDPAEPVDPDVDMILSSETSHLFWMQELNVPLAIATRKIVAKGSIQKALKLLPALKPAFALYPPVLREHGRGDLLAQTKKARKTKPGKARIYIRAFFGKISTPIDASRIPTFPLTFADGASCLATPAHFEGAIGQSRLQNEYPRLLAVMYTIRFFEEHLSAAFKEGDIPTEAIHLSLGQEGVAAGVCLALRDSDYLNTTHRGHGHIIAKGADLDRMMAEIYGRRDGLCGGRGGSMHVTDGAKGVLGANGIVGAGYLLAMGAGFTIKKLGRDDISVVFAGDGSVNQGMFHEAMNMISVFRLPVLVVIENNLYGEFTSLERHSAVSELFKRATAYGIEALRVDGNDARAVYAETGKIIEAMRADGKPRLLELMTYRWHGHMEGEPELYRTAEEKDKFIAADPIGRLEKELLAEGALKGDDITRLRDEARKHVDDAIAFAKRSPLPDITLLTEHAYTPEDRSLFEGTFAAVPSGRNLSVAQAINEALAGEMRRDERVFLWGEDVSLGGYFSVTEGLVDEFGAERIIDTPISENGIVGGAVGAAMTGMRPVAEILFSDFLTCCMDPLLNQAAKLRYMTGGQVCVPLVVRTPVGSGIGMAAQHSQSMERFFAGIPGLIVAAPCDAYTAKGMLKAAIRSSNPVLFFEHKLLYAHSGPVPDGDYTLPLGKARVARNGSDVTIATHLLGVSASLDAAELLAAKGIDAEVIDLATLYPLDTGTLLESVKKTGRLVTVEEGIVSFGIGAEVVARVTAAGFGLLKTAPLRIGAPECPIPYAKNLENEMLISPERIAEKIAGMM